MMTKPGITELDRCVDSRYTLVSMVAKRARMIGAERHNNIKEERERCTFYNDSDKPVTQAVNEIYNGVVSYVRSEAIERANRYDKEKFEALARYGMSDIDEAVIDDSYKSGVESSDETIYDPVGFSPEVNEIDVVLEKTQAEAQLNDVD